MEKGIKSKRRILEIAFRLFAAYSYPDVSYSLLEEATGISRGSMVYYFGNKEGIFRAVVETFLYNSSNARSVDPKKRGGLKEFYEAFAASVDKELKELKPYKITNLSSARLNIERSALQFIPEFKEYAHKVQQEDSKVWLTVVETAVANGELKSDTDIPATAALFQQVSYGWLSSGVYNESQQKEGTKGLKRLFNHLYALVKA